MTPDYGTDWQARRDMIWCAMTAVNSTSVKDPIAYIQRKQKKFGGILKVAVARAYEVKGTDCLAVQKDKIDEALSAANGWKTIMEITAP